MFIISRSAGKSNRAPVKKNCPPQLTVKAALWYDNKVCGRRFPAHGLPVRIHVCGSSVTLRLGFLTESKSEDNKKAADFLPFLSAPVVELADTMDLGDVTLMNVFSIVPRRGYSSVKACSPVFINADHALRSASASSPSQNQRRIK